jgi:hypothetical protein
MNNITHKASIMVVTVSSFSCGIILIISCIEYQVVSIKYQDFAFLL